MPTFAIPEQQQAALIRIFELPDESVERLASSLERVQPSAKSSELVDAVRDEVADIIPIENLTSIVSTLQSLYNLRTLVEASHARFARDLMASIEAAGNEKLKLSGTEKQTFQRRLLRLLDLGPLNISSKAFMLQREYEHLFHDAQLFTDIRPVFGSEVSVDPVGVVLSYILKVVYHDGTRHEEFYVALDADDLAKLKSVIERAEKKAETLKALLEHKQLKRLSQ